MKHEKHAESIVGGGWDGLLLFDQSVRHFQCEGRSNQIQVKSLFFRHSCWNTIIFDQPFAIAGISFYAFVS